MGCNTASKVSFGCCDIVYHNRTIDWIHNSSTGGINMFCNGYACPAPTVDEQPVGGWTSPAVDGAEWYDPLDSRSQHFLGATMWEAPVFSSALSDSRDITYRIDDGVLGVSRLRPIEAVMSFMLWVDDCCAIPFAKSWLVSQLKCASDGLPVSGCSKPTLTWYECQANGCDNTENAFRSLANVGFTDISFEPVFSYNGCCLGIEAKVTFKSESPYTYNFCETTVIEEDTLVDFEVCDDCVDILLPPEPICRFEDCQCSVANVGCNSCKVLKPVNLGVVSSCYCAPTYFWRKCWNVPATGGLSEQVLNVTLFGGKSGLKNVRLTGHDNPNESDTSLDYWRCIKPCVDIGISEVKPYETLIIDSARGIIVGNCGGGTFSDASDRVFDIGRIGSKQFVMDCNPIRFCVETAATNLCPTDAHITVTSSSREVR